MAFRGGLRSSLIATGWTGCPLPYGRSSINTASLSSTPVREHTFWKPASPSALISVEVVFRIAHEEEIGPQLRTLGIGPRDVKRVLVTHLHMDYDEGLLTFKAAKSSCARRRRQSRKFRSIGNPTAKPRRPDNCGRLAYRAPRPGRTPYFGARLASFRCKVRRCMLSRRAVSETLRPHNS